MKLTLAIKYDNDGLKSVISKKISEQNLFLFTLLKSLDKIRKVKNSVLLNTGNYNAFLHKTVLEKNEYNLLCLITEECEGSFVELAKEYNAIDSVVLQRDIRELKGLLKENKNGQILFFEGFKLTIKND